MALGSVNVPGATKADLDALKSRTVDSVLLADNWEGDDSPYMQDIEVEGLTSDSNGFIGIGYGSSVEQYSVASSAGLYVYEQEDNVLTIVATGIKPEMDLSVFVILLG